MGYLLDSNGWCLRVQDPSGACESPEPRLRIVCETEAVAQVVDERPMDDARTTVLGSPSADNER
jgi:hypothetical protein